MSAVEEPAFLGGEELGIYRQTLDETEIVLLAQQYLGVGALREALEVCVGRSSAASNRGIRLCEARARFGLGEREAAFALIEALLDGEPRDSVAAFYRAQFLAQSGDSEQARIVLRRLIAMTPDFPGALPSLAQLCFPGPPYREVLRRLHAVLRPRTYLEIGVEYGSTLQLATHSRVVCGVDPVAQHMPQRLPEGTRLFHMTSDTFFATHAPSEVFGRDPVELAFIDGLHLFEFALRDFANVERWCASGATVVLHDCLPVAEVAALRKRRTRFWVGDAWKAVACLLAERRDLRVSIVPCYPSGLVIVQGVKPDSDEFVGRLPLLEQRYASLPYPVGGESWPPDYPVVSNQEPELTQFIASLARPLAHEEPA